MTDFLLLSLRDPTDGNETATSRPPLSDEAGECTKIDSKVLAFALRSNIGLNRMLLQLAALSSSLLTLCFKECEDVKKSND